MNETQKAKAIELLNQDCKIDGLYIDRSGRTCALGCLALAAGVQEHDLRRLGALGIHTAGAKVVAAKIRAAFGLRVREQSTIQTLNDQFTLAVNTIKARRRRVVDYVKTL